jgi:hypothetical protein
VQCIQQSTTAVSGTLDGRCRRNSEPPGGEWKLLAPKAVYSHLKYSIYNLNKFTNRLGTSFFQEIPFFLKENKLISLGKIRISWENGVPKLALRIEK